MSRRSEIRTQRAIACQAYHSEGTTCEVESYLEFDERYRRLKQNWYLPLKVEIHHIFGRGTDLHESRCNLIRVGSVAHYYGHNIASKEFRIACLYAKLLKRLVTGAIDEFDPAIYEHLCGNVFPEWMDAKKHETNRSEFQLMAGDVVLVADRLIRGVF